MKSCDPINRVLRDPGACSSFNLRQWDLLIRQARHANLLGRIASSLAERQLLEAVPDKPRSHLEAALVVAGRQVQAVQWEVKCIMQALADVHTPVILLKGAAYVVSQLPAANGRLFADVDILVPKSQLDAVEMALKLHGWITTHHDAYDQRYYRTWMHELPPMQHLTRETVLDVHHTILPETARLRPDPQKLREAAIPVDGFANVKVLAPMDMVLHSATHLFHDGELEHSLRDLVDLDSLLRHFGKNAPEFWQTLVKRAQELDLTRPLFYALRYTSCILDTPVPAETLEAAKIGSPSKLTVKLMDALFSRAMQPAHASCGDLLTGSARRLLFLRSHWLRMPPTLLIQHLLHKAFISPRDTQY
jgi:hypothetical protein